MYRCLITVCLSLYAAQHAAAQPAKAADSSASMAEYEAQLVTLESNHGPYHQSLLEPLALMAQLARTTGDYALATELLNRQVQVTRTVFGLHHPNVLPLLRQLMAVARQRGDWEAVTDQLDHIRLQVANINGAPSEPLLNVMNEQLQWHLAKVGVGPDNRRARSFMAAYRLADEMHEAAEDLYGDDHPQTIPWLYQSALSRYRLVELLNADGGLGPSTVENLVRNEGGHGLKLLGRSNLRVGVGLNDPLAQVPVVERGERIGEVHLRYGVGIMGDILDIAEQHEDRETQAMALIYRGDFQLLRTRGRSLKAYRDAVELLRQSGIAEADIARFFSLPAPIPATRFHHRFADALAALEADRAIPAEPAAAEGQGADPDESIHYLGPFTAWEVDLAAVPSPLMPTELEDDLNFSRAEVSLRVSAAGRVSRVKVLGTVPDDPQMVGRIRRGVRDTVFRPAMAEGKGRRTSNARLTYRYLPEG